MDFIKLQRISYIGNKQTNRYKNNVQIYVQPYFTDKDTIYMVDLKTKKSTSNKKIHKMNVGKYTYYRFLSSQLSKHTDQYCLLINISKAATMDIAKKSTGKLDRYLLTSDDEKKESLLLVILNSKYREVIYYE